MGDAEASSDRFRPMASATHTAGVLAWGHRQAPKQQRGQQQQDQDRDGGRGEACHRSGLAGCSLERLSHSGRDDQTKRDGDDSRQAGSDQTGDRNKTKHGVKSFGIVRPQPPLPYSRTDERSATPSHP